MQIGLGLDGRKEEDNGLGILQGFSFSRKV